MPDQVTNPPDPALPTTSAVTFTVDEAEGLYQELAGLQVILDDDPVRYGPKRLNGKIAESRRMLDRCEQIFLEVSRRLHMARRAFRMTRTDLDLAKKHLYANDPETRSGRSISDREAVATGKLRKEVQEEARLENVVEDLDSVLTVVKAKRADLRDGQGRLRDQVRLCVEEIGLGCRWGSQVPGGGNNLAQAKPISPEDKALVDTLDLIEGEVQLARQTGTWTDPPDSEEDTKSVVGTKTPEPEPEPEPAPLPPPVTDPVAVMLPGSGVSTQDLDSFLEDGVTGANVPETLSGHPDLDDRVLEDILSTFEKK